MSLVSDALEFDPLFADELPVPYGPSKHADHEYLDHLMRGIGYIQDSADISVHIESDRAMGRGIVTYYSSIDPVESTGSLRLLWQLNTTGQLEFFLWNEPGNYIYTGKNRFVQNSNMTSVSNILSIEETGEIILADGSIFFKANPADPMLIRAFEVMENNGFRLMSGSLDSNQGYLFMKGNEIISVYRSFFSGFLLAERVEVKETDDSLELQLKSVSDLGGFLRGFLTRNYPNPPIAPMS